MKKMNVKKMVGVTCMCVVASVGLGFALKDHISKKHMVKL